MNVADVLVMKNIPFHSRFPRAFISTAALLAFTGSHAESNASSQAIAYEVNALDCLLKPVDLARLAVAIERVRASLKPSPDSTASRQTSRKPNERVFVRDGDRCWFVTLSDVHAFESVGNYSNLHLDQAQPLIL